MKITKPGTPATIEETKKEKVVRTKRTIHPLVGNADVKVYPFKATPPDYNFTSHKPLKKKDFASDEFFFNYKAEELIAKADLWKAKAEEARKLGSTKDRAKAKRLIKMQETMAQLRKQLEAQGINVDELMGTKTA